MSKKQKLELTWIGKGEQPDLEPRILIEDPNKSYGDKNTENMLIRGDNLLALKALEQDFVGNVKCIYIDPPYNTGQMFKSYDDGIEHSLWLSQMQARLIYLKNLLASNGIIWITLDDNEVHYCKVMCDEIFGRNNFIGNVIWEKSDSPRMDAIFFSSRHDNILVYAKDKNVATFNRFNLIAEHYNKTDEKDRKYYLKPLRAMGGQGDSREARPTLYYSLCAPDGTEVFPKKQDGSDGAWRWKKEKFEKEIARIEWINGRNGWNPYFRIYADAGKGRPAETIFPNNIVGSNRTSKAEIKALFPTIELFDTPKPEGLLQHIIHISTNEGDIVLDSFLGSGTTAAVAHKMGRKWIGVELGDHCDTHCVPRLKQVCDGTDQGGISKAVEWKGGGGFKYYELAPSLLNRDKYGNWVITKEYNPDMMAAAMTKHEGFKYNPSEEIYWKQGQSTENDFIFTTTSMVTIQTVDQIHEEMKEGESLLICCKSFQNGCDTKYNNITIKKIPQMLLGKCEFGKEDYSLNIVNVPGNTDAPEFVPVGPVAEKKQMTQKIKRQKEIEDSQPDLFGNSEENGQ